MLHIVSLITFTSAFCSICATLPITQPQTKEMNPETRKISFTHYVSPCQRHCSDNLCGSTSKTKSALCYRWHWAKGLMNVKLHSENETIIQKTAQGKRNGRGQPSGAQAVSPPSRSVPQPVTKQVLPAEKTWEGAGRQMGCTVLVKFNGRLSSSSEMS